MLFFSIALIIAILLSIREIVNDNRKPKDMFWVSMIPIILWGFISLMIIFSSYGSYLHIRSYYDGVISQYRDSIEMYNSKAISINMMKAFSLTDYTNQGYQSSMAEFVKDLRLKVTEYNIIYSKKRILKRNPFFNLYIIEPDKDMKLLSMFSWHISKIDEYFTPEQIVPNVTPEQTIPMISID